MNNLITDLDGVLVGSAEDERVASGVSVVIFEEPAIASIAIHGGAPGVRDGALLEPEMTVAAVDAGEVPSRSRHPRCLAEQSRRSPEIRKQNAADSIALGKHTADELKKSADDWACPLSIPGFPLT